VNWVIIQNLSGGTVRNCGQPHMAQKRKGDCCVVLKSREALAQKRKGLMCGFEQQRDVTFVPGLMQHKFCCLFETWPFTDDGKK
jgi:hypothetical protein